MTTARNKDDASSSGAPTPGDNRGAEDLDGNKAGARTGNKAQGPEEPEKASEKQNNVSKPRGEAERN